jgi:hypothetical protein
MEFVVSKNFSVRSKHRRFGLAGLQLQVDTRAFLHSSDTF